MTQNLQVLLPLAYMEAAPLQSSQFTWSATLHASIKEMYYFMWNCIANACKRHALENKEGKLGGARTLNHRDQYASLVTRSRKC